MSVNEMFDKLGLDRIEAPPAIDGHPRSLGRGAVKAGLENTPYTPPASPDDALAREAVARIEADEFGACADFRRHGCYDGDTEHRIALEAIKLTRLAISRQHGDGGSANNLPPSDHGD